MRASLLFAVLLFVVALTLSAGQESEDGSENVGWWGKFKQRVKTVLTKWRDDLRSLWDEVLAKASDMRSWTAEMFESFKLKMKEWLDSRTDVPDDEKNEIENFINKLKVPTEKPKPNIEP